jgi:HAD superfamily hydrolase (TIGR01509 family)
MHQLQAIIFDMDGVLVDSEPRHERAYVEIFSELGYGANHGIDFTAYYGRSDRSLWLDFMARHKPAQSLEQLIDLKQTRFLKILREDQPLFAGLLPLLEKLYGKYPLAVASGSWHPVIDAVLDIQNLRRFFSAVVSVKDVPNEKPAPDVFLRAAELLRVPPQRCCVIEDSIAGIQGARAAGMEVIGIANSLPVEQLGGASRVVTSYEEIERLLLGAS